MLITGILFFKAAFQPGKIAGILIAFTGMIVLFLANGLPDVQHISYSSLVLLAAFLYSLNINMVGKHLNEIPSLTIAAASFSLLIPLSAVVLAVTGFFDLNFSNTTVLKSTAAACTLGIAATAFQHLKDGCKDLLAQFYYEKKSLKEIADNLGLDPASVRNKKYRCMQELRALALQRWPTNK